MRKPKRYKVDLPPTTLKAISIDVPSDFAKDRGKNFMLIPFSQKTCEDINTYLADSVKTLKDIAAEFSIIQEYDILSTEVGDFKVIGLRFARAQGMTNIVQERLMYQKRLTDQDVRHLDFLPWYEEQFKSKYYENPFCTILKLKRLPYDIT